MISIALFHEIIHHISDDNRTLLIFRVVLHAHLLREHFEEMIQGPLSRLRNVAQLKPDDCANAFIRVERTRWDKRNQALRLSDCQGPLREALVLELSDITSREIQRAKRRGSAAQASCGAQIEFHCDCFAPNEAKIPDFSKIPAVSTPQLP